MKHQTVFLGFFKLDSDDVWGVLSVSDDSDVPAAATGTPTFLVLGKEGNVIVQGSLTAYATSDITGGYRFLFTPTSPDFQRGKSYEVQVKYVVDGLDRMAGYRFSLT